MLYPHQPTVFILDDDSITGHKTHTDKGICVGGFNENIARLTVPQSSSGVDVAILHHTIGKNGATPVSPRQTEHSNRCRWKRQRAIKACIYDASNGNDCYARSDVEK